MHTHDTELLVQDDNISLVVYSDLMIDHDGQPLDNDEQIILNESREEQKQLRQILNALLPVIPAHSQLYSETAYKQVSTGNPTRENVINLQRKWDMQLQQRQAREAGICAIREQLNSQAFDELIRQMTINLPERGLLSVRIRDEAKMTIDTYQTLYQSSLAFGMRKCVQVLYFLSCMLYLFAQQSNY